jgi:hypothetical protein
VDHRFKAEFVRSNGKYLPSDHSWFTDSNLPSGAKIKLHIQLDIDRFLTMFLSTGQESIDVDVEFNNYCTKASFVVGDRRQKTFLYICVRRSG